MKPENEMEKAKEHDVCIGCVHVDLASDDYPCSECRCNYTEGNSKERMIVTTRGTHGILITICNFISGGGVTDRKANKAIDMAKSHRHGNRSTTNRSCTR